ncbi:hypothetical protein GCM10009745_65600 [Kribbella yunnanensis]|uniref:Tat pathway signal sequence domain protein n=1 Tax=Kribbella yunnanensis TaxID=190194 RepID=A0ABN2INZ9_9ACTN
MNTFEDKLLAELRTVVAERPVDIRRKRPKRLLAGVAACLTLAAGTAVAVPMLGGEQTTSPAYAVTTEADGKVRVRIYNFTDAAGLEKRIRAAGVRAEVTILPPGKKCRRTPAPVIHEVRGAVLNSAQVATSKPGDVRLSLILDPAKFRDHTLLLELIDDGRFSGTTGPKRAQTGSFGPCVLVDR